MEAGLEPQLQDDGWAEKIKSMFSASSNSGGAQIAAPSAAPAAAGGGSSTNATSGALGGALAGAGTGASLGMAAGPYGAAAGAVVGAVAGAAQGILGAKENKKKQNHAAAMQAMERMQATYAPRVQMEQNALNGILGVLRGG